MGEIRALDLQKINIGRKSYIVHGGILIRQELEKADDSCQLLYLNLLSIYIKAGTPPYYYLPVNSPQFPNSRILGLQGISIFHEHHVSFSK